MPRPPATRPPSMDLLRTFTLAATHLNISRAASVLCVTPSAVSRQLQLLEEQMQLALFERSNRGLCLTEPGRQLYAQIAEPMARIEQAALSLQPQANSLSLQVDAAFAHTWLVKRLPRFKAQHPGITLDLRLGGSLQSLSGQALSAGPDLHILYGSPPWPGFQSEPLLAFREFPVCSPALLHGSPPLRTPADLPSHTMIHEGDRSTWHGWLAAAGVALYEGAHSLLAHDSLTCLSMAVAGQGVAMGDNLTCADYLAGGQLVKPFAHELALTETFHLAMPREPVAGSAAHHFRQWLRLQSL